MYFILSFHNKYICWINIQRMEQEQAIWKDTFKVPLWSNLQLSNLNSLSYVMMSYTQPNK